MVRSVRHDHQMSIDEVVVPALESLSGPRLHYDAAVELMPNEPGLHALYGGRAGLVRTRFGFDR